MLVLSRKNSEEVLVGDDIRLRILSIRGNTVRIGIEAPRSVSIKRGELVASEHILRLVDSPEWIQGGEKSLPVTQ